MADLERRTDTENGMLCPACKVDLVMTERQSVEIDYCPKCRGVWLDRGELDKIVERSGAQAPARSDRADFRPDNSHHGKHGSRYGHRRKSWLQEIFD